MYFTFTVRGKSGKVRRKHWQEFWDNMVDGGLRIECINTEYPDTTRLMMNDHISDCVKAGGVISVEQKPRKSDPIQIILSVCRIIV